MTVSQMMFTSDDWNYQCLKKPMLVKKNVKIKKMLVVKILIISIRLKLPMFKSNNNCHQQWLSLAMIETTNV